jgi:hypothetical protein
MAQIQRMGSKLTTNRELYIITRYYKIDFQLGRKLVLVPNASTEVHCEKEPIYHKVGCSYHDFPCSPTIVCMIILLMVLEI